MSDDYKLDVFVVLIIVLLYIDFAWVIFQWRNPTRDEIDLYRDFWNVVTLKKLESSNR